MSEENFKMWAVSRIEYFLKKIEETDGRFDIESSFYTIRKISERAYDRFHKFNEGVVSHERKS